MSSQKCASCGLVNFASDANCKRCGVNLHINRSVTTLPPQNYQMPPVQNSQLYPPTHAMHYAPVIQCPFCRATAGVIKTTKTSTGGWIVFAVMLLICFPFCIIGLFITENHTICRACGMKLS